MDEIRELPPKPSRVLLSLLPKIYQLYTATLRIKIVGKSLKKGALIASFHGDFFPFARATKKKELKNHQFAVMISNHTDAEYPACISRYHGVKVNRGDSLHEGFHALRSSLRSIKEGYNLLMAVDGPVGPRFKVKPGVIALAKQTKAPIQVVFCAAKNAYIFEKSWDNFVVPYPFSKIYLYIGECFHCDQSISREENLAQFNEYVARQRDLFSSLLPKKLKQKNDLAKQ